MANGAGKDTADDVSGAYEISVEMLEDNPAIDRTSINAWEDADFLAAVRAIRRRKLVPLRVVD